jgi:hypothetical protein
MNVFMHDYDMMLVMNKYRNGTSYEKYANDDLRFP